MDTYSIFANKPDDEFPIFQMEEYLRQDKLNLSTAQSVINLLKTTKRIDRPYTDDPFPEKVCNVLFIYPQNSGLVVKKMIDRFDSTSDYIFYGFNYEGRAWIVIRPPSCFDPYHYCVGDRTDVLLRIIENPPPHDDVLPPVLNNEQEFDAIQALMFLPANTMHIIKEDRDEKTAILETGFYAINHHGKNWIVPYYANSFHTPYDVGTMEELIEWSIITHDPPTQDDHFLTDEEARTASLEMYDRVLEPAGLIHSILVKESDYTKIYMVRYHDDLWVVAFSPDSRGAYLYKTFLSVLCEHIQAGIPMQDNDFYNPHPTLIEQMDAFDHLAAIPHDAYHLTHISKMIGRQGERIYTVKKNDVYWEVLFNPHDRSIIRKVEPS